MAWAWGAGRVWGHLCWTVAALATVSVAAATMAAANAAQAQAPPESGPAPTAADTAQAPPASDPSAGRPAAATAVAQGAPAETPDRAVGRPARTGFQMAFRFGVAFPFGAATGRKGDSLARRYSWQLWPLLIDIGAKATPHLHLGAYLGLGFGAEGSDGRIERYCDDNDSDLDNDIACTTVAFQLGAQAQYHFAPAARWNPWIGYGVGFEGILQVLTDRQNGYDETHGAFGYTVAKLDFGLDFRPSSVGLGPWIGVALGRYTRSSTRVDDELTHRGPIDDGAWHAWVSLGLRMVVQP